MRADNCDFDQLLIRSLRELAALSKHFKRKSNRISCESKNDHDFHRIVEETINFARIVTTRRLFFASNYSLLHIKLIYYQIYVYIYVNLRSIIFKKTPLVILLVTSYKISILNASNSIRNSKNIRIYIFKGEKNARFGRYHSLSL